LLDSLLQLRVLGGSVNGASLFDYSRSSPRDWTLHGESDVEAIGLVLLEHRLAPTVINEIPANMEMLTTPMIMTKSKARTVLIEDWLGRVAFNPGPLSLSLVIEKRGARFGNEAVTSEGVLRERRKFNFMLNLAT
jgi:hypothetical protein